MSYKFATSGVFRRDQLAGGAYRFCENFLRGLAELSTEPEFKNDFSMTVFHSTPLPWQAPEFEYRSVPKRLGRLAAAAWVGAVGSRGYDAVLYPYYFTPPIVRARRLIGVIHDLQFRHMKRFYSPLKWQWSNACHHWTLSRSDAVVGISDVVRNDILNQYGAKYESRVHTIHIPVALDRFDAWEDPQKFTHGRPYVMCVAMDRPQKNLYTLIRAFDLIKDRYPDYLLVMVGQLRRLRPDRREKSADIARDMPSTEDLVKSLGLSDRVVITGYASDAQLSGFYRGASAFVLPSLFEGFGIPAAEALSLRAPTLVSDLPVMREVTLGQARFFQNLLDPNELAERLSEILDNVEAARPSQELADSIRSHYAPRTIARKFYSLLTGTAAP